MDNKVKILYVDDEKMNLLLFEEVFKKKYNIITAESGMQAMDLLVQHHDTILVVSDMKMPLMNGLEFIKKAKVEFPNIKFYILTGFDITTEIKEAIEANLILNYFRKPFNFKELESEFQKALE